MPRGRPDPIPLPRSRWRVTIEVTSPAGAERRLDRETVGPLVQALRGYDAAGMIIGGRSCGAKLTVHARDLEGALAAALEAWRGAARDVGLVQWRLVRCEAVRDAGPAHEASLGTLGLAARHRSDDEGRQRLA